MANKTISVFLIAVQDKVEALQERLDAYITGDKTAGDSFDLADSAAKAKRCKFLSLLNHMCIICTNA